MTLWNEVLIVGTVGIMVMIVICNSDATTMGEVLTFRTMVLAIGTSEVRLGIW